jgi:hypothetical protein
LLLCLLFIFFYFTREVPRQEFEMSLHCHVVHASLCRNLLLAHNKQADCSVKRNLPISFHGGAVQSMFCPASSSSCDRQEKYNAKQCNKGKDIRDDTDRIRYEAIPDPTQYVCLKKHIAKIKCTDAHAPTLTSYEES